MFAVLKQCRKSEAVAQGPMLLKRLSLIGCMSLLVLTNITAAFSDPQVNEAVESKASKQTVVEKGDVVTVTYSSKEAGGEVFESKSIKFRVGTGTTYPGIEQAVLGMKEGEAKTIDVPAAEGYGEVDVKKFVDIPLQRSMPRQKNISLAVFKRSAKAEPEEGKWYTLRGLQWPVKVLKVENGRVLLDLVPEKETRIPALIGYALVTSDEKRVTTTMVTEARVGDQLTMSNGQHAKVAALDDKDITLDLNHPLAGRQVTFDFTITELTKTPPLIIPDLKKWEDIDGIGFNELEKKYRALLNFARPHIIYAGITKLVVPSGVPDIYGKELGVSFSSEKANEMIAILRKFEDEVLDDKQQAEYIRIGMRTACEYCCRVRTLVLKDGTRACGCAHSYAMRGLAKYLILNHDDQYSEDEILAEVNRWKALFFPKQSIQKVMATSKATGAFDLAVLQEMPNMVGGC